MYTVIVSKDRVWQLFPFQAKNRTEAYELLVEQGYTPIAIYPADEVAPLPLV